MSEHETRTVVSSAREWRGNNKLWIDSYRKYNFPVTVRKVGDGCPEAPNR
ncbi:hypothetical protein [Streptomyces uncialis]|nr:hypothetical protein [Streptomyces uncialis]